MHEIESLIKAAENRLPFYAPFRFIRKNVNAQVEKIVLPEINQAYQNGEYIEAGQTLFFVKKLAWDSDFFGRPIYKLSYALYPADYAYADLKSDCKTMASEIETKDPAAEIWIEIPSQEVVLMQALNESGFRLIETRLTYYKTGLESFEHERYPVKDAQESDIPLLRKTAAQMRNDFDRFHADAYIDPREGDRFLAQYAEAAVKGFCDQTLVSENQEIDSFMALNHRFVSEIQLTYSRIILTAAGPKNKGFHYKYCAETCHIAKERNVDVVIMTTQLQNASVIHNVEKLGFKLGFATHILSARTNQTI